MDTSRVVVNADDLGETEEITKGILECIDAGVVTSTTILANMPATDMAITEAIHRGSKASFGVHLNLCEGRPLTDAKSLVGKNGNFHPKRSLALRIVTRQIDMEELHAELQAQVARVHDSGLKISHLDSHKHLHQLPGVSKTVSHIAQAFDIKRVRCTVEEDFWVPGISLSAQGSRMARIYLAGKAKKQFASENLRCPDRTVDVRQVMGLTDPSARLALLRRPRMITELICHPGTALADVEKPGSCQRDQELQFLLSDDFKQLVEATPVTLQTYWDY